MSMFGRRCAVNQLFIYFKLHLLQPVARTGWAPVGD
jgi:hypothetical protein